MVDYSDIVYNIDKLRLISQYTKDPNSLSPTGRKMAEDIIKEINGYNNRVAAEKQPMNNQIQHLRLQNPAEIEYYKARQALINAPNTPYLPDEVIPFEEAMDKVDLTKSVSRRPLGDLGTPARSITKSSVAKIKSGKIPKSTIQQAPQTFGQIGNNIVNKGASILKNPSTYTNLGGGIIEGLLLNEALKRTFNNPWQLINSPKQDNRSEMDKAIMKARFGI